MELSLFAPRGDKSDGQERQESPRRRVTRARLVRRALRLDGNVNETGWHKMRIRRNRYARRSLYYNTHIPLRCTLSYRRVRMYEHFLS